MFASTIWLQGSESIFYGVRFFYCIEIIIHYWLAGNIMSSSIFSQRWLGMVLIQSILLVTECAHATVLPATTPAVQVMPTQTSTAANTEADGVRSCLYVPGQDE